MKLTYPQLQRRMPEPLAPSWLIAGDEPLLVADAAERIREAARAGGYAERELHVADRGFDWEGLEAGADNLSLFAARRIVELRLPSPRPGDVGGRTLRGLTERPIDDRLLIVTVAGRLDAAAARSAWVRSFETHGAVVEVRPIDRDGLPRWIAERAAALGIGLTPAAAELLADRVEGNLLAADQELRKLALTTPDASIDADGIEAAVADSARFDVFRLSDAVVAGDAARAVRVLAGLRSEGVAPALVCWALAREIGVLARLRFAADRGERVDAVMTRHGVWRSRQPAMRRAVARYTWAELRALLAAAGDADAAVKGVSRVDPWDALTAVVVAAIRPAAGRAAKAAS